MGLELKYNKKACSDQKRRNMIREIREVLNRYKWREDIERGLKRIGFTLWFEKRDDQIWGLDEIPQDLMLFISWINAELWIHFRIEKIDM